MTDLSRSNNGSDGDFYKSLGGLEATVLSHEKRLDEINEKLDKLLEASNRLRGGWVMLSVLMSVAATVGALSHNIIDGLKKVILG